MLKKQVKSKTVIANDSPVISRPNSHLDTIKKLKDQEDQAEERLNRTQTMIRNLLGTPGSHGI